MLLVTSQILYNSNFIYKSQTSGKLDVLAVPTRPTRALSIQTFLHICCQIRHPQIFPPTRLNRFWASSFFSFKNKTFFGPAWSKQACPTFQWSMYNTTSKLMRSHNKSPPVQGIQTKAMMRTNAQEKGLPLLKGIGARIVLELKNEIFVLPP